MVNCKRKVWCGPVVLFDRECRSCRCFAFSSLATSYTSGFHWSHDQDVMTEITLVVIMMRVLLSAECSADAESNEKGG